jgi:RNA polymerase subunit RPABC4/transcription elongation factor Spt4
VVAFRLGSGDSKILMVENGTVLHYATLICLKCRILQVPNPNYVCSICSQTFTRRWRGSVHNANLHSGLAKTVRLLDYIIGRANGDYMPSDPSWYRRPNRRVSWTKDIGNATYADRKDLPSENQSACNRNFIRNRIPRQGSLWPANSNATTEESQQKNKTGNRSNLDQADEFREGINKLAELKRLASKYLPPNKVQDMIRRTCLYCQQVGDDSPIDITLDEYRKKVKFKESLDYLNGSGS